MSPPQRLFPLRLPAGMPRRGPRAVRGGAASANPRRFALPADADSRAFAQMVSTMASPRPTPGGGSRPWSAARAGPPPPPPSLPY